MTRDKIKENNVCFSLLKVGLRIIKSVFEDFFGVDKKDEKGSEKSLENQKIFGEKKYKKLKMLRLKSDF